MATVLTLTSEVTYQIDGETHTIGIDWGTDCVTSMEELLDYLNGELGEGEELGTQTITNFSDIPHKWANESDCWEFIEALNESDYDLDVIEAALELGISPSDIDEAYQGSYSDDEDFAESFAEELGLIDRNAQWPMNCIDWEDAAKDLMHDYSESGGHYFRAL